ncbi:hypothetical protein TDB9533_04702 [Thalassocella blandensis]|nr:hypothetical protein TDB9533_04702 [Thalassocella blandensis]
MNIKKTFLLPLTATAAISVAALSFADEDEVKLLAQTEITLQQAIDAAVAHQGGQAYEAELEDDSFDVEYEVKVINNGQRYKITVDGKSGEVKRVREKK